MRNSPDVFGPERSERIPENCKSGYWKQFRILKYIFLMNTSRKIDGLAYRAVIAHAFVIFEATFDQRLPFPD